jgi:hypothetical protein
MHFQRIARCDLHQNPDALQTRELLRRILTADIERTWATDGGGATRYALQSVQRDRPLGNSPGSRNRLILVPSPMNDAYGLG